MQVIDWKNSSPKCVDGDIEPCSLTHDSILNHQTVVVHMAKAMTVVYACYM